MNKSKAKGTVAETAVVRYMQAHGWDCERRAPQGNNDQGDIAGIPHTVIEVKAWKTMALARWLEEAERERVNANARWGVVWHKRARKASPADWYVTMTGDQFRQLLTVLYGGR